MEDAFTGTRPVGMPAAGDGGDPLERWREQWTRAVAAAEGPDGDPHLAARRREYGRYLFVALDYILSIVGLVVLSIPLILVIPLFYPSSIAHAIQTGADQPPSLTLVSLLITDGALLLVIWYRLSWLRMGWSTVGIGRWPATWRWDIPLALLLGLAAGVLGTKSYALFGSALQHAAGRPDAAHPPALGPVIAVALFGLGVALAGFYLASIVGTMARQSQTRWRAVLAVATGLLIGMVGLVLTNEVDAVLSLRFDLGGQDRQLIEPLRHTSLAIVLATIIAGTFVAPAFEELFFRGYIFRAVAVRNGALRGYLVSAGAFAVIHAIGGGKDLLPLIPALFVLGLLLCYAYQLTGNLVTNISAHAFNNGVAFTVSLLPLIIHIHM